MDHPDPSREIQRIMCQQVTIQFILQAFKVRTPALTAGQGNHPLYSSINAGECFGEITHTGDNRNGDMK
jgi:hypothetical protein